MHQHKSVWVFGCLNSQILVYNKYLNNISFHPKIYYSQYQRDFMVLFGTWFLSSDPIITNLKKWTRNWDFVCLDASQRMSGRSNVTRGLQDAIINMFCCMSSNLSITTKHPLEMQSVRNAISYHYVYSQQVNELLLK